MIDLFLIYQFIKRLATPFNEWEAYKLGVIDEKGNILKNAKERVASVKERDAFGKFDLLVLQLKKLLEKIPGGNTRLGSYAAALWLIKENKNMDPYKTLSEETLKSYMTLAEEVAIANSAGAGQVASIGIGKDGEPGRPMRRKKKRVLRRNT